MDQQFRSKNEAQWDRIVTLELYRCYEHIRWAHRLRLQPAVIELMDSQTHWGQWNPETRVIRISRALVRQHSWFQVESILRHEMAHQYCSELLEMGCASPGKPHGELFQKACEIVGVPQEFSHASVDLKSTCLDWKSQPRSPESEKLFNKVQKLLALATSSNENEALAAMTKVRELYAKYAMDYSQLGSAFDSKRKMAHLVISHQKKRIEAHQDRIAGILAGHFFVQVIFTHQFDSKTLQSYKALEIIGTQENVLMAEYVYYFLLSQTEFLVRQLKQQQPQISRVQAKSYRLGILKGFAEKLRQMDKNWKKASVSPSSPASTPSMSLGKTLTLLSSDPGLKSYVARVFPRLSNSAGASQSIDPSLYSAGVVAGGKINLHRAVVDQGGRSGRLLNASSQSD
ncbi:MAG: SprT-like domain-containing protein [Bdellovibrionia bacterium]